MSLSDDSQWRDRDAGGGGEALTVTEAPHHATPLPPGTVAPDFELPSTPDQRAMLSDFRGQPVILVFYPEDWSPVCSDQLGLYQAVLAEFQKFRRGAHRDLRGQRVEPPGLRQGSKSALPAARRLRAEGRGGQGLPGVPRRRGNERAGAVRDRRRGRDPVELRVPGRREPGADGILRALEELPGKEEAT